MTHIPRTADASAQHFIKEALQVTFARYTLPPSIAPELASALFAPRDTDEHYEDQVQTAVRDARLPEVFAAYDKERSMDTRFHYFNTYIHGPVVADIGCGSGKIASKLQAIPGVSAVIGTDIQNYIDPSAASQIDFRLETSPDTLPIDSSSVDTVVVSYVLHHVEKDTRSRLIQELYRCLTPTGRLVVLEDTYSMTIPPAEQSILLTDFLALPEESKQVVLSYSDWLANVIFRHTEMTFPFSFEPIETWISSFDEHGFSTEATNFIGIPATSFFFSPRAVLVFSKK